MPARIAYRELVAGKGFLRNLKAIEQRMAVGLVQHTAAGVAVEGEFRVDQVAMIPRQIDRGQLKVLLIAGEYGDRSRSGTYPSDFSRRKALVMLTTPHLMSSVPRPKK